MKMTDKKKDAYEDDRQERECIWKWEISTNGYSTKKRVHWMNNPSTWSLNLMFWKKERLNDLKK
jgi:hypothetical protein